VGSSDPRPDDKADTGSSADAAGARADGADSTDDDTVDWLAVMGHPEPPTAAVPTPATESGSESRPESDTDTEQDTESDPDPDPEQDPEPAVAVPAQVDDEEGMVPLKRIGLIAGLLVVGYVLVTFVDVWITATRSYEGEAQAAVVLGAAQYNGEPSNALRGRLDRAAELYDDDRVPLVVVTGGGQPADETTEAKTGYDYLRSTAGIPDEDLRLEVDGTSTYESLAATARFLSAEGIDRVILVTDPYHARRSILIAEEVGLDAEVVPTDASVTVGRLLRETAGTAIGRLVGFRRTDAYVDVW
jgi:uncharacterized SAM-binding protein YcdF (DUF218 family)